MTRTCSVQLPADRCLSRSRGFVALFWAGIRDKCKANLQAFDFMSGTISLPRINQWSEKFFTGKVFTKNNSWDGIAVYDNSKNRSQDWRNICKGSKRHYDLAVGGRPRVGTQ